MSTDYTSAGLVRYGTVGTPTNGDVIATIYSKNHSWLIVGITARIVTQGAQAASAIEIYNLTKTTLLASLVLGTAAAGTTFELRNGSTALTTKEAYIAAGDVIQIRAKTTDAAIVYTYEVFATSTID